MSQIARVARGPDRGDYRPVSTEYGETYWHRVGKPNEVPRTQKSMLAWLQSGKATWVVLQQPNADASVDVAKPPEVDPVNLEDLDLGEKNFLAEILGWSHAKRLDTLRRCGVVAEDAWDRARCNLELLAILRRQNGRRRRPKAAPAPTVTPVAASLPADASPSILERFAETFQVLYTPAILEETEYFYRQKAQTY